MKSADEIEERMHALYGLRSAEIAAARGVLHPAAVWQGRDGALRAIRIGPSAPKSETDLFALELSRARADAILTSGLILREEPGVHHAFEGSAWPSWRAERLGKSEAPLSVVLTSGRDLDFAHPFFRRAARALVVTSEKSAQELAERALRADSDVRIVGRAQAGLGDTLCLLREEYGAETLSVEAGPRTSSALYREPVRVDELLLSIYQEPELAEPAIGGVFFSPEELAAVFPGGARSRVQRSEGSGSWEFLRYRSAITEKRRAAT